MLRGGLSLIFLGYAFAVEAKQGIEKTSVPSVTDPVGFGDFAKVILGLLVIVGAIFFLAWIVKRIGYINTHVHGALKVIGGLSLTQRERIILVQVGKKQILLGVAPGRITTLHELEENIETSSNEPASGENFAQKLQQFMSGKKS